MLSCLQELLQQLVGGNSGVLVPAGQTMIGDSCFYQLDEKFVNNLVSLQPSCCACCPAVGAIRGQQQRTSRASLL